MTPTSRTFLDAIELTETSADRYEATPQPVPWPKAYGGDMVAQALAAAIRSTGDDRVAHSTHSYFLRPVDEGVPVAYEVERLRDGGSYATRQVRGIQNGQLAFTSLVSLVTEEHGPDFAPPMPLDVPAPETLRSSAEALAGVDSPAAEYWAGGRSFDMRHVPSPVYLSVEGEHVPHQGVWVKSFDALGDDPVLHQTALAYVCDYTILEPVLRQQGRSWSDAGLMTASLDHSMWFHRPGRLDEWVLYAQEAVSAQAGRGLARGSFYSRDGVLLASVVQEGMIRTRRARG